MNILRLFPPCALICAAFLTVSAVGLAGGDSNLYERLEQPVPKEIESAPLRQIYSKDEVLWCTGENELSTANNRAAGLMAEGSYAQAARELERALAHAPLFLPYRYNLGLCYIHLNDLETALLHFTKAQNILPEYPRTYIQIGYIYGRRGKDDLALEQFKAALHMNPKELVAISQSGDIYYSRGQYSNAEKYYSYSLELDPRYPNGLLGIAKIHFNREEYFKAIIQIKSIDTKGEYDKSLHYYYAESSYKLKDYKTAYEQYRTLLTFRNDKFFLVNSLVLIEHKMNLAKKFLED
ncbi:MAG: tetratricopeptide repeat protein [Spirochaetes bacterium]|nr:MAG: tetratricopeptide repeat protein [Spirochaetota bacterium]